MTTFNVSNEAQFNAAVQQIDTAGSDVAGTIDITSSFTLSTELDAFTQDAVVIGNGNTIDGGNGQFRGLMVMSGANVTFSALTVANTKAVGGAGGDGYAGGGGGAGLGGGLFVASAAEVTLSQVYFSDNQAIGGAGGSGQTNRSANFNFSGVGAGGGGGMGGGGGYGGYGNSGGGGGGIGRFAIGQTGPRQDGYVHNLTLIKLFSAKYGLPVFALVPTTSPRVGLYTNAGAGIVPGGAGGGTGGSFTEYQYVYILGIKVSSSKTANKFYGGSGAGYGGGGGGGNFSSGAGGGIGGASGNRMAEGGAAYTSGGVGGFGGGGGGAGGLGAGTGGAGGFGGGGGGGDPRGGAGGVGGFGGGGGGGTTGGLGGFGAGHGAGAHTTYKNAGGYTAPYQYLGGGGGGLGAGGAIFVEQGGNVFFTSGTIGGAGVSGGAAGGGGATAGSAFGSGIFAQSGTLQLEPTAGHTVTINDVIADEQGSGGTGQLSLLAADGGLVVLSAANTYTGTTAILTGTTLELSGDLSHLSGAISNAGTLLLGETVSTSFSGALTGNGVLVRTGTGNVSLSNVTGFTGNIVVNSGALSLSGSGSTLGNVTVSGGTLSLSGSSDTIGDLSGGGTLALASGSTLIAGTSDNTNFSGALGGAGTLVKQGSGTLTLPQNLSGALIINAGAVLLDGGGATEMFAGGIVDDATLILATGTDGSAGAISGNGTIVQDGAHTLSLAVGSTFSGATTIESGALAVAGAVTQFGGTITDNAELVLSPTGSNTLEAKITGTGGVEFDGSGTLTISNLVGATGAAAIAAGVVQLTNGAYPQLGSSLLDDASLIFAFSGNANDAETISGTGSIVQAGTGTLTLSAKELLTGAVIIDGGTVLEGVNDGLAHGVTLSVNSGTFDLNGHTVSVGHLAGSLGIINLDGGTLIAASVDPAFNDVVTGSGALVFGNGVTVTNHQTMVGAAFGTDGALINQGGTTYRDNVTRPGVITGNVVGGTSLSVNNAGTIEGTVSFGAGGVLVNQVGNTVLSLGATGNPIVRVAGVITGEVAAGTSFLMNNDGTVEGAVSFASGSLTNSYGYTGGLFIYPDRQPGLLQSGVTVAGSAALVNAGTIQSGVTIGSGTITNRYPYSIADRMESVINSGISAANGLVLANGGVINGGVTAGGSATITNYYANHYNGTINGPILLTGSNARVTNQGTITNGVTLESGGTVINKASILYVVSMDSVAVLGPGQIINGATIGSATAANGATLNNNHLILGLASIGAGGTLDNSDEIGFQFATTGTLIDAGVAINSAQINGAATILAGGVLTEQSGGTVHNVTSYGTFVNQAALSSNYSLVVESGGTGINSGRLQFVQVDAGGFLANQTAGSMQPSQALHDFGSVSNAGYLSDVTVYGGAGFSNLATGTITGSHNENGFYHTYAEPAYISGLLTNAGLVSTELVVNSGGTARLLAGGTVTNGVKLNNGGTLFVGGSIGSVPSNSGVAIITTGGNNVIELLANSTNAITGKVFGNYGDTVVLPTGTGAQSGIYGVGHFSLQAGADWSLTLASSQDLAFSGSGTATLGTVTESQIVNAATLEGPLHLSRLTNQSSGVVVGNVYDSVLNNSGRITGYVKSSNLLVNAATVSGSVNAQSGSVTNAASATITGTLYNGATVTNYGLLAGVHLAQTLINKGTIGGQATPQSYLDNYGAIGGGVYINSSNDTVVNRSGATIALSLASGAQLTLNNQGVISNGITAHNNNAAINGLKNSGTIDGTVEWYTTGLYNTAGGVITGSVYSPSYGAMTNGGVIDGSATITGALLSNQSTGTIDGSVTLVSPGQSATLENAGIILGSVITQDGSRSGTIVNTGTILGGVTMTGHGDRLVLAPTAVTGGVLSGNTSSSNSYTSVLELQAGTGTIAGFVSWGSIVFDNGADWTLGGSNTLSAQTKVFGTSTLDITGTLVNQQSLALAVDIGASATLVNGTAGIISGTLDDTGAVVNGGKLNAVSMTNDDIKLINQAGGTIANAVTALGNGDVIANSGTIAGGATLAGQNDTLALYPGAPVGNVVVKPGNIADLELFAGHGTLTNSGVDLSQFAATVVDPGAYWSFGGSYTFTNLTTLTGGGTLAIAGTLTNASTLIDNVTFASGTFVNQSSGVMVGLVANNASVTNAGTISGNVALSGGELYNQASGLFSGSIGGGTLKDAGTLSGATFAHASLVLAPGYDIVGSVSGAAGSVLELQGSGTLSGVGSRFVGFQTIKTDGTWALGDSSTLTGQSTLIGAGTLTVVGMLTDTGTLVNQGTLDGPVTIATGAMLTNQRVLGGTVSDLGLLNNAGTLNAALLSGTGSTLSAQAGGTITGAVIASGNGDVVIAYSGIAGGVTLQGVGDTLSIGPSFIPAAYAINGNGDVLLLNGNGTLSGLGSTITGFDTLAFASGGSWVLGGANTLTHALTLANAGTLTTSGTLVNEASQAFGVSVAAGGTLVNQVGGTIAGPLYDAGSVNNAGSLSAGVTLGASAELSNQATGIIGAAVSVTGANATLFDAGTITVGITLSGHDDRLVLGTAAVATAMTAAADGSTVLELQAGSGTLDLGGGGFIGSGTIMLDAGADWDLDGTLASGQSLLIIGSGTLDASDLTDAGSLTNAATLQGTLAVASGGSFSNLASGTSAGISLSDSATMSNAGTIGAIAFGAGSGRLIELAGGVITGSVAGTASDTLEFSGTGGTLGGLGAHYTGFGSYTIDTGASWTAAGSNTVASSASFGNSGLLTVGGTLLDLGQFGNAGDVSGGVTIGPGGTFDNQTGGSLGGVTAVSVAGGYLLNQGVINPGTTGVVLASGSLSNAASGYIAGGLYGVAITGSAGFNNAGTISSNIGTAVAVLTTANITLTDSGLLSGAIAAQMGSGADRLILEPGVTIQGALLGSASSTLELGSAAATGTLGVLGTSFGETTLDAGASWELIGGGSIAAGARLDNAGTLALFGGYQSLHTAQSAATLLVSGILTNVGTITSMSGSFFGSTIAGANTLALNGGTLSNAASGVIAAYGDAVTGTGTLRNAGNILTTGTSTLVGIGVALGAGSELDDFGTITSDSDVAVSFAGTGNVLVLEHGAAFLNGTGGAAAVIGGASFLFDSGGNNTLVLAASTGTLAGGRYQYFDHLTVNAGVQWTASGSNDFVSATNDGTLVNTGYFFAGSLNDQSVLINDGHLNFTNLTFTNLTNASGGDISSAITVSTANTFVNLPGAVVSGIYGIGGGLTLRASGIIDSIGDSRTAVMLAGSGNRLILTPDTSLRDILGGSGYVYGGSGDNALELAGGSGTGALLNPLYIHGFDQTTIDSGAAWEFPEFSGTTIGATINTGSTLTNYGTAIAVNSLFSEGVVLNKGTMLLAPNGLEVRYGSFTNAAGATVSSTGDAVQFYHYNLTNRTIVNHGVLIGTGTAGVGVAMIPNGHQTLITDGTIIGNSGTAVDVYRGLVIVDPGAVFQGAVIGSGYVELTSGVTLNLQDAPFIGVRVTLDAGADLVTGTSNTIGNGARITNPDNSGVNITLSAGQTLSNDGYLVGAVYSTGGATIIDSGFISGSGGIAETGVAVSLAGGGNLLRLGAGSGFGFQSSVVAGAGDTLELAGSSGGISYLGSDITGFGAIIEDADTGWSFTRNNTIDDGVTLTANGNLNIDGPMLVDGVLIANGLLQIDNSLQVNGVLQVGGTLAGEMTGNVTLTQGGELENATIDGEVIGTGNGVTIASGTIVGQGGTAVSLAGTNELVAYGLGVDFGGIVAVGGGTLELLNPSGRQTFSGLGTLFTGFDTLQVDAAVGMFGPVYGIWALTGTNTLNAGGVIDGAGTLAIAGLLDTDGGTIAPADFINDGTLSNSGSGLLRISDTVSGVGFIDVNGGTLELDAGAAATQSIDLRNHGTLLIGDGPAFHATITGFNTGEVVGLVSGATIAGNFFGQTISNGATLYDAGLLSGGATFANATLQLASGFATNAPITGEAGSVLELVGNGTVTGLGSTFSGFPIVQTDGNWTLTGANTIAAPITFTGAGELTIANTLVVAGTVANEGTLAVAGMLLDTGLLSNSGAISGASAGVVLQGGSLINNAGGSIFGAQYGVTLTTLATTLTNAGYIGGPVSVQMGSNDRLVLLPGEVMAGALQGNAGSTLELQTGSGTGTLTSLGTGIGSITVDSGAVWALTGTNTLSTGQTIGGAGTLVQLGSLIANGGTIAGLLDNDGTIVVASSLLVTGAITSDATAPGVIALSNATLDVQGSIATTSTIDFGPNGTVVLGNSPDFDATLIGFQPSDVIDMTDVAGGAAVTIVPLASGALTVIGTNGVTGTLNFANAKPNQTYTEQSDGAGGTEVIPDTVLNGGTLNTGSLTIAAGTKLTGFGVIEDEVNNAGSLVAQNGTLQLTGSVDSTGGLGVQSNGLLLFTGSTLTAAGSLINDGQIVIDPSTMTITNMSGSGAVTIGAASTLNVLGSIAATETITFADNTGFLQFGSSAISSGTIAGFVQGDTIDLTGLQFQAGATASISSGTLSVASGGTTETLMLSGIPDGAAFAVTSDSGSGTALTLCFCVGTLIRTPRGDVPVEKLIVGELVNTWSGGTRPITWIGTGKVMATRGKRGAATPVIVQRNALSDGVPSRDLRITKGHALLLDGVLIPVEELVNHRSIIWDDRAQEVSLFHVELDAHDVLVANGAPAESYRDDGNRWLFQNANGGWGQPAKAPVLPLLTSGPIVDAIWRRLLDRSGPRPGLMLTDDADLHLVVDGHHISVMRREERAHLFRLNGTPHTLRIVSRAAIPMELGLSRDPRQLGVAVRQIRLWQGHRLHVIDASDLSLTQGFHEFEPVDGIRWTDGDAVVPGALLPDIAAPCVLELILAGAMQYPLLCVPTAA